MIGPHREMNTYRACYLEFTALVKPLNMVEVWVWPRGKRQLLHHLHACQVVAAATVNNDVNGAFLHNAFGMEQGVVLVVLVLLWLCNLHAEYALHNKTLILVSICGIHMFFLGSCNISGNHSKYGFFGITS
jgi:hypothetical protein